MSSFLAFANSRRASTKERCPSASNGDVSKTLASMWREASFEIRQPYIDWERRKRQEYKTAMADWKKKDYEQKSSFRQMREQKAVQLAEEMAIKMRPSTTVELENSDRPAAPCIPAEWSYKGDDMNDDNNEDRRQGDNPYFDESSASQFLTFITPVEQPTETPEAQSYVPDYENQQLVGRESSFLNCGGSNGIPLVAPTAPSNLYLPDNIGRCYAAEDRHYNGSLDISSQAELPQYDDRFDPSRYIASYYYGGEDLHDFP